MYLTELVQVHVGKAPNSKTFAIHKGLASFYSGYFEAATKECFKDGISGSIELATETVNTFERFVKWL